MIPFLTKTYQQHVLDSVEAYFLACHGLPSPSLAFTATSERLWQQGQPCRPLAGFAAGAMRAELSEGRCRFEMLTDRAWASIERLP